jgi:hypothetical protein
MPTLADIYSAINTAKRKGSDFVQNPVTSLQQMVGNANDRARGYNQEMVQAAQGFSAPARGQQATPEQLAAQQSTMDTMASAYNPMGMVVYHGSPAPFTKFDTSKIGSGEGSQIYGRGFYLAETPEVAKQYQAMAANPARRQAGLTQEGRDQAVLDSLIAMHSKQFAGGDLNKLVDIIERKPAAFTNPEAMKQRISEYVNDQPPSYFYKVDLPDTHIRRMLDWDSPLKNQPKNVRNLAKSLGIDLNDLGGDLLARVGKGDEGKKILQDAGIPGVKYLDQYSRDGKTGTKNFVVFDPNHLKILERNDQPIK